MTQELARRLAVITQLVEGAGTSLGRTAVMKLLYFLVKIRRVPLGYRFTLYSYGPFDSTVLEDVDYAARLGALTVNPYLHSGGYGYSMTTGNNAAAAKSLASDFIARHKVDVDWVLSEFGTWAAADLELASTIVYIDDEMTSRGHSITEGELARQVHGVKSHFSIEKITSRIQSLIGKKLLKSVH